MNCFLKRNNAIFIVRKTPQKVHQRKKHKGNEEEDVRTIDRCTCIEEETYELVLAW